MTQKKEWLALSLDNWPRLEYYINCNLMTNVIWFLYFDYFFINQMIFYYFGLSLIRIDMIGFAFLIPWKEYLKIYFIRLSPESSFHMWEYFFIIYYILKHLMKYVWGLSDLIQTAKLSAKDKLYCTIAQ